MAFTSAENAANARLGQYNDSQLANDRHRQNFLAMLSDAATVSRAIAREGGAVAGAAAVIQALDADTDGAIAQYVQSDISLRFAAGGIQKHIATAMVAGAGQTLTALSETTGVWIDPTGVEHTGETFVSTARGAHELWIPASAIGPGINLQVGTGGLLTSLTFPSLSSTTVVIANGNALKSLDLTGHKGITVLQAHTNQLTGIDGLPGMPALATLIAHTNKITGGLDLSGCPALTFVSVHTNAMAQSAVDGILADLVAAGVTNCTVNIGGTNAPPSATGDGHVTTLTSRGCTVTHS